MESRIKALINKSLRGGAAAKKKKGGVKRKTTKGRGSGLAEYQAELDQVRMEHPSWDIARARELASKRYHGYVGMGMKKKGGAAKKRKVVKAKKTKGSGGYLLGGSIKAKISKVISALKKIK
jgi:hypothetical protein